MTREVWHKGEVAEQFIAPHTGRWATRTLRKPLPDESEDQFPKMKGNSGSHNTHSRLSPSSAKSWTRCTGAISLIEANSHRIPKEDRSAYSDEGTEAHDWAERVLTKKITIDEVPENFRPYIDLYVKHCLASIPEGASYDVEVKVPLFYQPSETGTCDFMFVSTDRIVVRDYKHGAGVLVTNEENEQLAIYAYSAIKDMEDMGIWDFDPATPVDIGVFQPRHREAENMVPWVITLSDLALFCSAIDYAAIQAKTGLDRVREKILNEMLVPNLDISIAEILEAAPGLRFAPGEGDGGACRWCKAKGFCEARLNATTEDCTSPQLDFNELIADMPDLSKADAKLPVDERIEARVPGILDDAYLVRVFKASKNLIKWLDDVAEYLETRVMAGEKIPGLKLVMGREGNRAWTDEGAADKLLSQSGKLKMEDRYKMSLISPTQAEEKLKEKIESSTRFRNCFQNLVGRSPAKPVLALESDKREAIASPVDDMPDVDDDLGEL